MTLWGLSQTESSCGSVAPTVPMATTDGQRPWRWWAVHSPLMRNCNNMGNLDTLKKNKNITADQKGKLHHSPPLHLLTFKTAQVNH